MYKAVKSIQVKAATAIVTVVLFALILLLVLSIISNLLSVYIASFFIAIILLGFFFFYGNSPRYLMLGRHFLLLRRNIGEIKIPYDEVVEVRRISDRLTLTLGSVGYWGYIGNTKESYKSYVVDKKNMFVIQTARNNYLLSCSDADELIEAIGERVKEVRGKQMPDFV